MKDIEKEVIADKQIEADLIESGVIRISELLISELALLAEDGRLTLERIRTSWKKIGVGIGVYDKAIEDLESMRKYYTEKAAKEAAQSANKSEGSRDA